MKRSALRPSSLEKLRNILIGMIMDQLDVGRAVVTKRYVEKDWPPVSMERVR